MSSKVEAQTPLGESVVDEVRAIREAIDEEVGHDLARLVEESRLTSEAVRRQYGMKVADLPPRHAAHRKASPRLHEE